MEVFTNGKKKANTRGRSPEENYCRQAMWAAWRISKICSRKPLPNLWKRGFMQTVDFYISVAILICVNASKISSLNSDLFRQKVCSHLCIYFAEIVPNEFPRTTRHTTAGIPAEKNKRQNCSETTLLIAILAF